MCREPLRDARWLWADVAQVRFDVDGALVPEGEAVVVCDVEGVGRDERGRVGGGPPADVVAGMGELEERGGVVVQRLLEEDLGGFGFQLGDVGVREDGCEMDVWLGVRMDGIEALCKDSQLQFCSPSISLYRSFSHVERDSSWCA